MKNRMVFSRTHRILNHLSNFHKFEESTSQMLSKLNEIHLQEEEIIIGFYENNSLKMDENIIVTNLGLHIFYPNEKEFISYQSIIEVEIPRDMEKTKLDHLIVHLNKGQVKTILISGGHDRFRDVYEFVRFIDRVKDDVKKEILN
jgi:hypothetical protein